MERASAAARALVALAAKVLDEPPATVEEAVDGIERAIAAEYVEKRAMRHRLRVAEAENDALLARLAAVEKALAECGEAADEVNARYIGGSPVESPRFEKAMERLVMARLHARNALAAGREGGSDHAD